MLLPGLVLIAWALLLACQGLMSLLPDRTTRKGAPPDSASPSPKYVVLMPAHDEADIIFSTVKQTMQWLSGDGELLVVADNCTDNTASLAREAGARVVERHHAIEKGKGFALAYGLAQLASDPPDVVLILDADCKVEPNAIGTLVAQAHALQRPVQGRYDMLPPPEAGRKQRMAAFAWSFRARFRAEGYRRAGLPCQLMGSGMAFPWELLQRVNLANGHLVEDLKLGLDLARIGRAPVLCPQAIVNSQFPMNEQGARSQRQRWEHGHLSMIFSDGPALLWDSFRRRNGALLAMVLDMSVPPLAFLMTSIMGYGALAAILAAAGWISPWGAALLAAAALATVSATVLLGWWRVGRGWISAGELATAPLYVLRKLPVYLGFLTRKQIAWVRTRRD